MTSSQAVYPKKVRVSWTLEYYEHIETKSSQKSSLLNICAGGSLIRWTIKQNASLLSRLCRTDF